MALASRGYTVIPRPGIEVGLNHLGFPGADVFYNIQYQTVEARWRGRSGAYDATVFRAGYDTDHLIHACRSIAGQFRFGQEWYTEYEREFAERRACV